MLNLLPKNRFLVPFAVLMLVTFGSISPLYSQSIEDEMMMDQRMGNGHGMPPQAASGPAAIFSSMNLAPLMMPSIPAMEDKRPPLKKQCDDAFLEGRTATALELFFGHLVIEPDKAKTLLEGVKYSALLKRPVWQVRWGVSLFVRGDEGGDKGAITDSSAEGGNRSGRNGNRGEFAPGESGPGEFGPAEFGADAMGGAGLPGEQPRAAADAVVDQNAEMEMQDALGLVAELTAEQFTQRFSRGDFGIALSAIIPAEPEIDVAAADSSKRNRRDMRDAMGGQEAAGMPDIRERERMIREQMEAGGMPPEAMMMEAAGAASQMGINKGNTVDAVEPLDEAPVIAPELEPFPMWKPGIVYLGLAPSTETIKRAQKHDIDFLLHFDVVLKPGRDETIQNVSRCRLIKVSDGKTLGLSKPADSNEVQRTEAVPRDYVSEQISNLFAIIDRQLALTDMPKLSPEIAKRRVASMFSGSRADRMKALAEIRLYQAQQLISDEEAEKAFYIVGGGEAMKLMYGTQEDKIATVHQWVTEALTLEE
ncbi:hypothetical protein Pla52o_38340 [Novipirellula galeiformis]|uniref:Uncharacterized protein n=1 Tax=Novipirellula galeiformis TaxID=2528004 RepID=A0A5C6CD39_9BACT|nr:hypothetical protein [Novipirellula galeiformis]TWU21647.1 hypothetical protein Pla52o_38340 [Novipirellula galeiformis]